MKIQIPNFANAKIVIFGDVMLDRYWYGNTHRISPEAPVPIVHVRGLQACPGGAGNVALNVVTLGASAKLFGLCGKDEAAKTLKEKLLAANVSYHLEAVDHLPTTTKLRVLSVHQQLLRLDFEEEWHEVNQESLLLRCLHELDSANALILSDYGKGCLVDPQRLIQAAKQKNIPIIIDPKRLDFQAYRDATIITPNFSEFVAVVGECTNQSILVEKGTNLMKDCNLDALLITQGSKGMTLLSQNNAPFHLPAESREVYDVTGAGDTVVAMIAASLAANSNLNVATCLANTAAGIVVSKLGAASVTISELRTALDTHQVYGENFSAHGIVDRQELLTMINSDKTQNKKMVMVVGHFDILHKGYIDFLETAKSFGDYLIVAVYEKTSTPTINSHTARMTVLASLNMVDWVVPIDQNSLNAFIQDLLPETLVLPQESLTNDNWHQEIKTGHVGEIKVLEVTDYLPQIKKACKLDEMV